MDGTQLGPLMDGMQLGPTHQVETQYGEEQQRDRGCIRGRPPRHRRYRSTTEDPSEIRASFVARLLRYGPDTPYKKCIVFDGEYAQRVHVKAI